jgi:RNA polymerase sigma factor (sigma-70 family)
MEASALRQSAALPALAGRSPLLRLQSDERLIALTRRGHHGAFEALVQRYQPRLLAFCRHMLGSQEDAEDVLQEVFTAAFNAVLADDRPINARPWLYRIARNRSLNHLRRPQPAGQDSMDIFERDGGTTTADTVHKREEFRQIVSDVHDLPETQRTALLLREIDALSYDQIAETMDTTVPSVKSLLVRARVSLAEAAEARLLTCEEVRLELGQVAEGLTRTTAPVRRHLKVCDRCRTFRSELRKTTRALAAIYPLGPLVLVKSWLAKASVGGAGAAGAGAGSAATGGAAGTGIAGVAATAAGGITAGGAVSAGVSTLASKAAAGMAAAVIVTAGAVEVKHVSERQASPPAQVAAAPAPAAPAPAAPPPAVRPASTSERHPAPVDKAVAEPQPAEPAVPVAPEPVDYVEAPPVPPVQEEGSTVTLPPREENPAEPTTPPGEPTEPTTQPGDDGTTDTPPSAPPAGEPGGTSDPPPPPPPPPPPAP